jgi:hypothetical protein
MTIEGAGRDSPSPHLPPHPTIRFAARPCPRTAPSRQQVGHAKSTSTERARGRGAPANRLRPSRRGDHRARAIVNLSCLSIFAAPPALLPPGRWTRPLCRLGRPPGANWRPSAPWTRPRPRSGSPRGLSLSRRASSSPSSPSGPTRRPTSSGRGRRWPTGSCGATASCAYRRRPTTHIRSTLASTSLISPPTIPTIPPQHVGVG